MPSEPRGRLRSGDRTRPGLGGVACAAVLVLFGCSAADPAARRDVLLVTIDTLRADWLGAYGFEHGTSPNIDALAAQGAVFSNAVAAATLTAPAHASIMTSLYPRQHSIGVRNGDTRLADATTLAERFSEAGYDTAAFVSNVVLRKRTGLDRGFALYDDELEESESNRVAYFERVSASTGARAVEWLARREGRPFFLWVHLQDPHGPYTPPEEWLGRVGRVALRTSRLLRVLRTNVGQAGIPAYQALGDERDPGAYAGRYAEEILYADHWVGEVLAAARAASGEAGLVVALTADHGESLGERGFFFQHGHATTPELARVPLIVSAPDVAPGRHEAGVSHVDLAPTLLELAGLPALPAASGLSLAPVLRDGAPLPERLLFCDTNGEAGAYRGDRFTRVGGAIAADLVTDEMPASQLQTLARQPSGTWRPVDLDLDARDALLRYIEARAPLVAVPVMEPEHVEQLRALGYLPPEDAGDEPDEEGGAAGARD